MENSDLEPTFYVTIVAHFSIPTLSSDFTKKSTILASKKLEIVYAMNVEKRFVPSKS